MKLPITTVIFLALATAFSLVPSGAYADNGLHLKMKSDANADVRKEIRTEVKSDIKADLAANILERIEARFDAAARADIRNDDDQNNKKDRDDDDGDRDNKGKNNWVDIRGETSASGTIHAPGIIKKFEEGKVPFGVFKKWFGRHDKDNDKSTTTSTTSPDTKKPVFGSIRVMATGTTTATLRVNTNEQASIVVRYGTSSALTASTSATVTAGMAMKHDVVLSGLTADTTYYYLVTATDGSGNVRVSEVKSFKTDAVVTVDVTPPRILFAFVLRISSDFARVVWFTNEPATGKVWLSASGTVDTTVAPKYQSTDLTYFHSAELTGLSADTQYRFVLSSADGAGNVGLRADGMFTTNAR